MFRKKIPSNTHVRKQEKYLNLKFHLIVKLGQGGGTEQTEHNTGRRKEIIKVKEEIIKIIRRKKKQ